MQIQLQAMAWFEEDDYEAFRSVLPDRSWHRTYGEWEAAAEQSFKRFNDQGIRTIKAKVRSAEFVAWCRSTGRDIKTQALTEFANEAAMRHLQRAD